MHLYLHILGKTFPSYGFMICCGVILANVIGMFVLKHWELDFNDFMILEAYTLLGGFIGAKGLYILVSFPNIEWNKIFNLIYLKNLVTGGYVFYGGLIGGFFFLFFANYVHHIENFKAYIVHFIFLIPLVHGFGRIGCFCAGCCYGIPYEGIFSIIFPEGGFAPSGISLFPVQLLEAAGLWMISFFICFLEIKKDVCYTVELYIGLYSILRFVLEFFRYDSYRGKIGILSISQWISILLCFSVLVIVLYRNIILKNK